MNCRVVGTVLAVSAATLGFAAPAWSLEWRVGVAYASGVDKVADLYEKNLRSEGLDAHVDVKFPLGLVAGMMQDWASGVRVDLALGPAFFIGGDVDHFELPISATLGYNFMNAAQASPYVRAGVAHHFASGDFYERSDPGLFAAAGLDFRRFSLEVAIDKSLVEFKTVSCTATGACEPGATKLNTYDIVASFFWKFRVYPDPRRGSRRSGG